MGAQRVTSDIVEDLHSADPECEPSAAKIIMGRAAGEIERLREHKQQSLTLIKEQQNELEDMRATLDKSAKLALSAVRAERAAIVAFIDRHKKQRVEADSLWDEGYEAALDNIAAAIKARGET
jgi:hypothetical protein